MPASDLRGTSRVPGGSAARRTAPGFSLGLPCAALPLRNPARDAGVSAEVSLEKAGARYLACTQPITEPWPDLASIFSFACVKACDFPLPSIPSYGTTPYSTVPCAFPRPTPVLVCLGWSSVFRSSQRLRLRGHLHAHHHYLAALWCIR